MLKALIVYASLTGNTEEIAHLIAKKLKAKNVTVEVEGALQVYPEEFEDVDICIVGTYTYGTDGEIPDEIIDFYDDLGDVDLTGKVFGLFGSGQSFYEHFCRAVDYFEDQFKHTNAHKGADSIKFELNASGEEDFKRIDQFIAHLIKKAENRN